MFELVAGKVIGLLTEGVVVFVAVDAAAGCVVAGAAGCARAGSATMAASSRAETERGMVLTT